MDSLLPQDVRPLFNILIEHCMEQHFIEVGRCHTLVTKRKVYFGLLEDISVFLLQPTI